MRAPPALIDIDDCKAMQSALRPIYLLADSQLLFWKIQGQLFLQSIVSEMSSDSPRAAYVGAANGDNPEYYEIFLAAMDSVGIYDCRMVSSTFTGADESFLGTSDLIVLAGGRIELGWRAMNETGLAAAIVRRASAGAVVIGISAGAICLGRHGFAAQGDAMAELVDTFHFLPFVFAVHDEANDWEELGNLVRLLDGSAIGIGIPSGGGAVYFPDGSLQAIRHPLCEISVLAGRVRKSLLMP
jgi:cyanophycinase